MSPRRFALRLAKRVYRATPFPWLRRLYFRVFLRLVRRRRTLAEIDGIRFELDLGEMIEVAVFLGEFETDIVDAIRRYCLPGWCVLDIGANVGVHTLRFARAVGPGGRVYAFEPTDYAYAKLVRNVGLNSFGWVRPLQMALTDGPQGLAPIDVRSSWRTDGRDIRATSLVEFRRLDDWCEAEHVERVDLVKIDVDGNEYGVLNGGRALFARCRPLLFIEAGLYHYRDAARNPFRLLAEMGYRFWDSKSMAEYDGIAGLERALARDPSVDSFNVIASIRDLLSPGGG